MDLKRTLKSTMFKIINSRFLLVRGRYLAQVFDPNLTGLDYNLSCTTKVNMLNGKSLSRAKQINHIYVNYQSKQPLSLFSHDILVAGQSHTSLTTYEWDTRQSHSAKTWTAAPLTRFIKRLWLTSYSVTDSD